MHVKLHTFNVRVAGSSPAVEGAGHHQRSSVGRAGVSQPLVAGTFLLNSDKEDFSLLSTNNRNDSIAFSRISTMFNKDELTLALDLQARTYELLRWAASAAQKGFIPFEHIHTYSSQSCAAADWINRNYDNIPLKARPERRYIQRFSALFSTYLENSFNLFDAPSLAVKSPQTADKKRAQKLMRQELHKIASEHDIQLTDDKFEHMLTAPDLRESIALCTYGSDIFHRMNGVASGVATVVIWRKFAWWPTGSPKRNFQLTADMIIEAENLLYNHILSYQKNHDITK